MDETRAPPGEPYPGKSTKEDVSRKDGGPSTDDDRKDKASPDRREVPKESTKPSGIKEEPDITSRKQAEIVGKGWHRKLV